MQVLALRYSPPLSTSISPTVLAWAESRYRVSRRAGEQVHVGGGRYWEQHDGLGGGDR